MGIGMQAKSIKPGGTYEGGKRKDRRTVIVIFRHDDPKIARVKFSSGPGDPRYVSLTSFARWANHRISQSSKEDT